MRRQVKQRACNFLKLKGSARRTVRPLVRVFVKHAEQLARGDALGVDGVDINVHEVALTLQVGHGRLQHAQHRRLAARRLAHQHQAVAHLHRLKQLDGAVEDVFLGLHVHALAHRLQGAGEQVIVRFRHLQAREEVTDHTPEQRQIVRRELGNLQYGRMNEGARSR